MKPVSQQERSGHAALYAIEDLDERMAGAMGDRAEEWRAYRQDWKRGAVERSFPLQLDFALNESCNMKCPMCTWSDDNKKATRTLFSLEHYQRILAESVPLGLKAVGLNGVNEPLMRRDLPDFVRAAKDAGVLDVMLHTNGMLLTREMSRGLVGAGLTRLFVSIDAVSQETYDKIRVGGDLAIVRRNVETFLDVRGYRHDVDQDAAMLPVLGLCFVRMAVNAHEEAAFVEQWQGKADFFSLQSYMNPFTDRPDKLALASSDRAPAAPFVCAQPFQRMRVSVDGRVHPCCSFYGDDITVGTTTERIANTWRGASMSWVRHLHASGRVMDSTLGGTAATCRACLRNSYTAVVTPSQPEAHQTESPA